MKYTGLQARFINDSTEAQSYGQYKYLIRLLLQAAAWQIKSAAKLAGDQLTGLAAEGAKRSTLLMSAICCNIFSVRPC